MTTTPMQSAIAWAALDATLDGARLLSDLTTLCSPRFAGRRVGTAGHDLARYWLVAQLAEAGLQPQRAAFTPGAPVLNLYAQPRLTILPETGGGGLTLQHQVEFAEHPRSADAPRPLPGIVRRQTAEAFAPESWLMLDALPSGAELDSLAVGAAAAGVVGLLAPQHPGQEGFLTKRVIAQSPIALPLLTVRPDLLPRLEGRALAGLLPLRRSTPTGLNVLASLPGGDPAQDRNPIVVSAHYDGVGDDPGGLRLPAASDNAAAVALGLGLARLFAAAPLRLRHPLIFAALDAEEIGAFGSLAHASTLREAGLAATVINIDGAGRLGGGIWVDPGAEADDILTALDQAGQELELPLIIGAVASDNRRYAGAGFPAVGISSGGHGYHTPTDTPQQVQVTAMIAVGQLILRTILHLAA